MGKELSLARSEEERQSMLLAITSNGESITASSSRNERTEEPSPSKGYEGGKVKDTKTKGKSSRKAKGADARHPRPKRRRQDNQDRESDRGDEGDDDYTGRGSEFVGVI